MLQNNNATNKNNECISYIVIPCECDCSKMMICQPNLIRLFELLTKHETRNLQMSYMMNKYSNIYKYITLFKSTKASFLTGVYHFFKNVNKVTNAIRNNQSYHNYDFVNNTDFLRLMKELVIEDDQPLQALTNYYKENNKFPLLKFKLF